MIKEIAIILLFVLGTHQSWAHGGHLATFTYQIEPTVIHLEFRIEVDILDHFDLEKGCPSYEQATALNHKEPQLAYFKLLWTWADTLGYGSFVSAWQGPDNA